MTEELANNLKLNVWVLSQAVKIIYCVEYIVILYLLASDQYPISLYRTPLARTRR